MTWIEESTATPLSRHGAGLKGKPLDKLLNKGSVPFPTTPAPGRGSCRCSARSRIAAALSMATSSPPTSPHHRGIPHQAHGLRHGPPRQPRQNGYLALRHARLLCRTDHRPPSGCAAPDIFSGRGALRSAHPAFPPFPANPSRPSATMFFRPRRSRPRAAILQSPPPWTRSSPPASPRIPTSAWTPAETLAEQLLPLARRKLQPQSIAPCPPSAPAPPASCAPRNPLGLTHSSVIPNGVCAVRNLSASLPHCPLCLCSLLFASLPHCRLIASSDLDTLSHLINDPDRSTSP